MTVQGSRDGTRRGWAAAGRTHAMGLLCGRMNLPSAEKPTEKKHKPLEIVAELEKIAEKHVKLPLK